MDFLKITQLLSDGLRKQVVLTITPDLFWSNAKTDCR